MKFEAMIFDLDGVLVFTDQFHYKAWGEVAQQLGVYFDEKINDRLRGVSRMQSLDIILERYTGAPLTPAQKLALAEQKNSSYRALLQTMAPQDVPAPVRQTLQQLRCAGVKLAVGSSSKNAKLILQKTELTGLFDAVADGNDITHSKPDPEVFLKAATFLGVAPQNSLVIEDAPAGIEAAKAGGFTAAAIGNAVPQGAADYRLHTLADLLKFL